MMAWVIIILRLAVRSEGEPSSSGAIASAWVRVESGSLLFTAQSVPLLGSVDAMSRLCDLPVVM